MLTMNIVPETLSDGSKVYQLQIVSDGDDNSIELPLTGDLEEAESHALAIRKALESHSLICTATTF